MDVEKTIQFLLEQQARFDARQAELNARQAEIVEREAQFEQRFEEGMVQINEILVRVASAQERTNEILATLAGKHVELAERHQELEQNVSALVSAMERHIAGHS